MKNTSSLTRLMCLFVLGTTLVAFVAGCSDDKPKQQASTTTNKPVPKNDHNPNPWDHSGEVPVTENQKHQFAQQFADQCIKRETERAIEGTDPARFATPCNCIAHHLAKDLTSQEAEKFLDEHENPHSLEIKYENAAYHCLQQQQPHHGPDFSRKPQ